MADPRDAGHEADLLAGFLAEEVDAGCAPRGLTTGGRGRGSPWSRTASIPPTAPNTAAGRKAPDRAVPVDGPMWHCWAVTAFEMLAI